MQEETSFGMATLLDVDSIANLGSELGQRLTHALVVSIVVLPQ